MQVQQLHQDPTAGLELVSALGRQREATRYLFRAINSLDPDRILECEYMQPYGGGEEVSTNCFRRTLHGFVPRAFITPLEVWVRSYPVEHLAEGMEDNVVRIAQVIDKASLELKSAPTGAAAFPGMLNARQNVQVKFFPGEDLPIILRAHGAMGVVEVKALAGQDWYVGVEPGVAQQLNNDFFPTRPIKLKAIRELIEKGSSLSPVHKAVAEDMHKSCNVSERWAQTILAEAHMKLRLRQSHQHVYAYSNVERSLLEQLDMQPQDIENTDAMSRIAEMLASRGDGNTVTPELIGQIAAAVAGEFAKTHEPVKRGPGRPPKVEVAA